MIGWSLDCLQRLDVGEVGVGTSGIGVDLGQLLESNPPRASVKHIAPATAIAREGVRENSAHIVSPADTSLYLLQNLLWRADDIDGTRNRAVRAPLFMNTGFPSKLA